MIITGLVSFLVGYFASRWLVPGFETVYIIAWLAICPGGDLILGAFKRRDRFGFMRYWPGNTLDGWGYFGERANNDGYIFFDWQLKQIIWRKPRTYYTRAMRGGIGLGPARTWFNIEADHGNRSCFSFHIMFPFGNWWDGPPRWHYLGRISIGHYPQNNEPEAAPC